MTSSCPPKAALWQELLISGASVGTATVFTNPLDVIKTRLQLVAPTLPGVSPPGLVRTGITLVRTEGVLGLWKGVSPSVVRGFIYGGMRLGLYGPCREAVSALASPGGKRGDAGGMGVKIGAGIISGALAAAVTNPTELIKTRLQAKDNQARSTLDAVRQVLRQDGTVGLWRGAVPSMVRAALLTASQVATYDSCKREVMGATGWGGDSLATQFAASSGAGLVTTTMTNPADVIKTRMFVAGGALKRTIPETIIEVYRADGLAGYFKGWTANYARLGPQTVITFMASEALRTALGLQGL